MVTTAPGGGTSPGAGSRSTFMAWRLTVALRGHDHGRLRGAAAMGLVDRQQASVRTEDGPRTVPLGCSRDGIGDQVGPVEHLAVADRPGALGVDGHGRQI